MENKKDRRVENIKKSLFEKKPLYIRKTNLKKLQSLNEHNNQVASTAVTLYEMASSNRSSRSIIGNVKSDRNSDGKSTSPFVKRIFKEGHSKGFVCLHL